MSGKWLGGGEAAWLAGLTTSIRVHEERLSRNHSWILVIKGTAEHASYDTEGYTM